MALRPEILLHVLFLLHIVGFVVANVRPGADAGPWPSGADRPAAAAAATAAPECLSGSDPAWASDARRAMCGRQQQAADDVWGPVLLPAAGGSSGLWGTSTAAWIARQHGRVSGMVLLYADSVRAAHCPRPSTTQGDEGPRQSLDPSCSGSIDPRWPGAPAVHAPHPPCQPGSPADTSLLGSGVALARRAACAMAATVSYGDMWHATAAVFHFGAVVTLLCIAVVRLWLQSSDPRILAGGEHEAPGGCSQRVSKGRWGGNGKDGHKGKLALEPSSPSSGGNGAGGHGGVVPAGQRSRRRLERLCCWMRVVARLLPPAVVALDLRTLPAPLLPVHSWAWSFLDPLKLTRQPLIFIAVRSSVLLHVSE